MASTTPPSAAILSAAARNCGEGYAYGTIRMGRPSLVTDLVVAADLGLSVAAPPNGATVVRPPAPSQVPDLLRELRALFSGVGGGWQIIDPWSLLDLASEGFSSYPMPCMVRPSGGSPPQVPPELRVIEVTDGATLDDMNAVILAGYEMPSTCAPQMYTAAAFGDPHYRAWVGYVDDVPVSTATACVAAGLVGVYVVATIPAARGHGYGEALTWTATMSAHQLDATLQASPMGRPIYERMGYETVATYTVWTTEVRSG